MGIPFTYQGKEYSIPDKYDYVKLDDEMFRKALAVCYDGEYPIVTISGAGGCGKSVIYQIIYDSFPGKCLAMASTGVAAFNIAQHGIKCSTIHSALRLSALPIYNWDQINPGVLKILDKYEYLLIDEISMVDCNLLDYILSHVRYLNGKRPKGGKLKVILFGDVLQLPPVSSVPSREYGISRQRREIQEKWRGRYGTAEIGYWFFSPVFMATKRITIELKAVYRQEDGSFKSMLEAIRFAKKDELEVVLKKINERVVDEEEHRKKYERDNMPLLFLTGRNDDVKAYNERQLECFSRDGVEKHEYSSVVAGPFTDDKFYSKYDNKDKEGRECIFKDFFPTLEDSQCLYLGQQVMCLCNDRERGFQNGTLGKIIDFRHSAEDDIYLPYVKTFDDRKPFLVPYHEFEYYAAYMEKGEIVYDRIFTVKTLACKSAYAVTFHKAQGLTLDAVYIDTRHKDSESDGGESYIPDSGIYLGLSRCRTLEGIGLNDTITQDQVRVNGYATLFFLPTRDDIVEEGKRSPDFEKRINAKNIIRMRRHPLRPSFLLDDDEED